MTEKTITRSYKSDDGRSAERSGTVKVAGNLQELLAFEQFGGSADKLVSFVNEAIEAEVSQKLYAAARLEVVGVEDTVERLRNRMIKDAEKLGVTLSAEIADNLARQALGLSK